MVTSIHSPMRASEPDKLVPFTRARALIGISRSQIYLLMNAGAFPRPVKIGRNNYFSEQELGRWIAERLAARFSGEVRSC